MRDTIHNSDDYFAFYEEVAQKYPETAIAYANRGPGSRYWTVCQELSIFSRRGKKMLDVGCNDGVYTIPYCLNGGQALGIDISPTLVQKARENATRLGIEGKCQFMQVDIQSPDFTKVVREYFDIVLLSEVLEHLITPEKALTNIYSVLKQDGFLILTTPTPRFEELSRLDWHYAYTLLAGKKLLESQVIDTTKVPILQEYGISGYLYRHDGYYPRALRKYVENFGLRCKRCYTIGFPNPLSVVRRLFSWTQRSISIHPIEESSVRYSFLYLGKMLFRSGYRLINLASELTLRRIPLLKYFGVTNVMVFRKLG